MNTYEKIYTLLGERTNPNTKAKAAAKAGKMAKKARSLIRKGGKVRGIDVSKEAMAHMSGRGEGSQSDEAPGVTAVRQLKIAAPKHKRGEVEVTSSHGAKTTGTELVKRREEIPDADVVGTSKTTKPEGGKEVEVDKVHTSQPASHYATTQATSIVRPKDPAYMEPRGKREKSRAYKKRTTGHTTMTTHPGRVAPRVSQWKQSKHVVIEPRKDEMNLYARLYGLLEGKTEGEQRGRVHLERYPQARDPRRQARGFGAGPHDKPDAGEGTSSEVKVSLAKAEAALKLPTLTGLQRSKIQAYYNRLTNQNTGVTASIPIKVKGAQNESEMNSYEKIYNLLVEMQQRPLKTDSLTGMIFRRTEDDEVVVRNKEGGPWRPWRRVDKKPKKK